MNCSKCNYENRAGTLFCENCGKQLQAKSDGGKILTRRMVDDSDEVSAKATWGSARFSKSREIIIQIRNADQPIKLMPRMRLVFGRHDQSSEVQPDVDFGPYGALQKGVSRQHAALEISEDTLMISDVGSSNGTFLNGQRLTPNQPRVLRDGDEVRLGKLVTHIYFG